MSRQLPLIVVLGATACGKSRLAIELARKFNGEIISADSMQVYHGLDIVTNKVTEDEQRQAKHHMINFLSPTVRYSVVDFRDKSLHIIGNLMKSYSLPIVVGGTNYYIESLLWKSFTHGIDSTKYQDKKSEQECKQETLIELEAKLLGSLSENFLHTDEDFESAEKFFSKPIYNDGFTTTESAKLWAILEKVDPVSAHIFHPNDKRRIIRALQIIQETGRNYSEMLQDINKSNQEGKASLGGPLRFPNTCVIWLDCDNSTLERILDERVDQMLTRGLLAELEHFHEYYNKQRCKEGERADYEKGVFQTIGFKEFHNYLVLDPEIKGTDEGNKILTKCISDMKVSTKRYAKKQLSWIRKRFLRSGSRDLPPIFKLTTSIDDEKWNEQVRDPALKIVDSLLGHRDLSDDLVSLRQEPQTMELSNNPGKHYCESCDRLFIGSHYIERHLSSKRHKKNMSQTNKKLKRTDG